MYFWPAQGRTWGRDARSLVWLRVRTGVCGLSGKVPKGAPKHTFETGSRPEISREGTTAEAELGQTPIAVRAAA